MKHDLRFTIFKIFSLSVALLLMGGHTARCITPFYFKSFNADGTPQTNQVTMQAWPPAASWSVNGTNLIYGFNLITNLPDATGFFSNAVFANSYRFQIPALNTVFYATILDTTNYLPLTVYLTGVPVSLAPLNNYQLVTNWLGFAPATNNAAGILSALQYTPASNSYAGISAALNFFPATNSAAGITNALGWTPPTNTPAGLIYALNYIPQPASPQGTNLAAGTGLIGVTNGGVALNFDAFGRLTLTNFGNGATWRLGTNAHSLAVDEFGQRNEWASNFFSLSVTGATLAFTNQHFTVGGLVLATNPPSFLTTNIAFVGPNSTNTLYVTNNQLIRMSTP